MGSSAPVIEALTISKRYPSARLLNFLSRPCGAREGDALREVSFAVYPGEMVGLLGPNGAGKTTLLKIAATMLYPSSGSMRIAGFDVSEAPIEARRRIGLVTSDERSFYWRLTGRQNLQFFAALWDVPPAAATARISELLERLGLTHAAENPFYTYSSGMKQKMAIARGLLANPSIVLYDEPTRALDPLSTRNIREWLRSHRAASPDAAHLIATNQMDEAEQLCDRIIVLNRGRVVAEGAIDEIRERLQEHLVHRIACRGRNIRPPRPNPAAGLLAVLPGDPETGLIEIHTAKDTAGLSIAIEQIFAQGGEILSCEAIRMTLDDVICSIVENDPRPAEVARTGTL